MKTPSQSLKKTWGWTSIAAGLVAMGLHLYLALEYYQLKLGIAPGKSVCNISATFNCEVVALSPYSQIFGVPMAFWGFWTNLMFVLLMLGSVLNFGSQPQRLGRLAQVFSWGILGGSIVMGVISTRMGTYCLFCMGAYATSILIFAGAWIRTCHEGSLKDSLLSPLTDARVLLLYFVAVPALSFLSHSMMLDNYGAGRLAPLIRESVTNWPTNPQQEFDLQKGLSFQASTQEPKATVIEFIDLLCPHCKIATPGLHSFAESRPDVRLIVKLFPLDGGCSSDPQMPKRDGLRCQWSYALFCFEQVSQKGWPALNWIFEKQDQLSLSTFDSQLSDLNQKLQTSPEEIKKCMDQAAVQDYVKSMAAEGVKAGVEGTPSIYVNGKKLDRGQFIPVLDEAYQTIKK